MHQKKFIEQRYKVFFILLMFFLIFVNIVSASIGQPYNLFKTVTSENSLPATIYQNGTFIWVANPISTTQYGVTSPQMNVYKYYANMTYTGESFKLSNSYLPYGIDYDGTYLWASSYNGTIERYYLNGTYTGFSFVTNQTGGIYNDTSITGLAYEDGFLYTQNLKSHRTFKYYTNGTSLGTVPQGTSFYSTLCQNSIGIDVKNGAFYLICVENYGGTFWTYLQQINLTTGNTISKTNISSGINTYYGIEVNSTNIVLSSGDLNLYNLAGTKLADLPVFSSQGTSTPRGITIYGDTVYIMENTGSGNVWEFYKNGTFIRKSLFTFPEPTLEYDLTNDGTYFYVTDYTGQKVYRYWMNGTYTGFNFNVQPTGLTYSAYYPMGIDVDGDYLWMNSFFSGDRQVLKYWKNGTYTGEHFYSGNYTIGNNTFAIQTRGLAYNISEGVPRLYLTDTGNYEVWEYFTNGTSTERHFDTYSAFNYNPYYAFNSQPFTIASDGVFLYTTDSLTSNAQAGSRVYSYWIRNPNITIAVDFPPDKYVLDYNESIDLNYSITGFDLDTCLYWVENSTGYAIIGNTSLDCNGNNTQFNVSQGEGTYYLHLFVNDTYNEYNYTNSTFYISTSAPAINLLYPEDNAWLNHKSNIYFNFTASDTNDVSQCILYNNYSGSWVANQTWDDPLNGQIQTAILSFPSEKLNIKWNVWCNDTLGNGGYFINNKTFNIDETFPTTAITNIVTTSGSQAVTFYSTSNDNNAGYTCKFSVFNLAGGIEGINENISFTCNNSFAFSVSGFATYVLKVYTTDLAGNENWTNQTFVTFTTLPPSGGGGGGGVPVVSTGNWTMETAFGGSSYQFTMIQKTSRENDLIFENLGTTSRTIKLTCEPVSGSRNLCDTTTFDQQTFTLPLQKGVKTSVPFTVTVPEGYDKERYVINLVATDEDNNKGIITVTIDVTSYASITGAVTKLFSSTSGGIPYVLFFFLIAFMTGVLANFLIFKPNKIPSAYSILVGLFFGIIFLLLPI